MLKILFLLCALIAPSMALAEPATLTWNANTEDDLAGYKIYQSTIAGQYGNAVATLGAVTTYTATLPPLTVDQRYFFTVTAYDGAGNESGKSVEVNKLVAGVPVALRPGTPVLLVTARTTTSITLTYAPVPDGAGGLARVGIRWSLPPIRWGAAPQEICAASPCTITGLPPGTAQEFMAVAWSGEAGLSAVFGPLSAVVAGATLPLDIPPVPPVGLQISKATPAEIMIVASAVDCPGIVISTSVSTSLTRQTTVQCRP